MDEKKIERLEAWLGGNGGTLMFVGLCVLMALLALVVEMRG
jgi:hypothetical protein